MFSKELVKIEIAAFENADFSGDAIQTWSSAEGAYVINPEMYSEKIKIEYTDNQVIGSSGYDARFEKILPSELKIDIMFDSTGIFNEINSLKDLALNALNNTVDATPYNTVKKIVDKIKGNEEEIDRGVSEQIKKFKEMVANYQGEVHQPYYLRIKWADLIFDGKLAELNINYKLFNPHGYPIRAVASCTFKQTIDEETQNAQENRQSPDITHERTVKEGDTLPLFCEDIYKDASLAPLIAQENGILNFRKLIAGTIIKFPPLK